MGAVPLYLKDNSYGEFVFDFGWAAASERAGLRYYPKLIAAVPFTPVTGRRLLVHPRADRSTVMAALLAGIQKVADAERASSVHFLFCTEDEAGVLADCGYATRLGMQFHWYNRTPTPYRDFDDYLGALRSRNRKQMRKERGVCRDSGLRVVTRAGTELDDSDWQALATLYRANAARHDSTEYLVPEFFDEIRRTFAHRVVAAIAYDGQRAVAGTLNFERGRHIYGRYWGTLVAQPMLHFELCYYQLIDRAIARGQVRFEAGAGGEHKLKRGLLPAPTWSAHWLRHPDLGRAVARAVAAEAVEVKQRIAAYQELSPFARAGAPGDTDPDQGA